MQKVGLTFLIALLAFALIFALLPTRDQANAKTGAHLQDVQLTLYPMRDPDAICKFGAARVTNDPTTGITELTELSQGERLIREKTPSGTYTGQETLDATLSSKQLTIDQQDDLITPEARIYLLNSCADIHLNGTAAQPVKIEQGAGFSTPVALVDSPNLTGRITRLRMTFDFVIEDSGTDSVTTFKLDPNTECVNGKIKPLNS